MRSGDQSSTQPVRVRSIIGGVLVLAGLSTSLVAAVVGDWSTSTRTVYLGIGTVLLILGVLLGLAGVARHVFTWRSRSGAAVPLLARTNLSRNPRRTAATAFALTLGVALVCAVGILGASIKFSVFGAIEEEMTADAVVSAGVVSNQSIPAQAIDTGASHAAAGTTRSRLASPASVPASNMSTIRPVMRQALTKNRSDMGGLPSVFPPAG